jgi:hypothetical protein
MTVELLGDQAGEERDLVVVGVDEVQQRSDAQSVRASQRRLGEQGHAGLAEQVAHRHGDAFLGQHRMHLRLEPGAKCHALGAVTDQLAQLPDLRRSDPRLRQPPHAQQIAQVAGVQLIVLHPPVGPALHTQRMGQVHVRAARGEHIGGPVPPVRCLEHHFGVGAGLLDRARQRDGVVVDADLFEDLTVGVLADDH